MRIPMLDVLNCTEDRYWTHFGDSDWTRLMFTEGLGYNGVNILSLAETPDGWRRDLQILPRLHLPDALERTLGRSLAITDSGTFSRTERCWRFRQKLSVMTDKVEISGTMRTEPDGPGRTRRISEVQFEARVFGLGSVIEKAAEGNVRRGFSDAAAWINRWLAAHP